MNAFSVPNLASLLRKLKYMDNEHGMGKCIGKGMGVGMGLGKGLLTGMGMDMGTVMSMGKVVSQAWALAIA